MLCRAKASSVSQVGLDAATDSVLFFPTGGVSFCSGVDAPAVRWANRRLHRRHSFTRLLTSPRVHKTLRVPPAMEAGVADHAWSLPAIARFAGLLGPVVRRRSSDWGIV